MITKLTLSRHLLAIAVVLGATLHFSTISLSQPASPPDGSAAASRADEVARVMRESYRDQDLRPYRLQAFAAFRYLRALPEPTAAIFAERLARIANASGADGTEPLFILLVDLVARGTNVAAKTQLKATLVMLGKTLRYNQRPGPNFLIPITSATSSLVIDVRLEAARAIVQAMIEQASRGGDLRTLVGTLADQETKNKLCSIENASTSQGDIAPGDAERQRNCSTYGSSGKDVGSTVSAALGDLAAGGCTLSTAQDMLMQIARVGAMEQCISEVTSSTGNPLGAAVRPAGPNDYWKTLFPPVAPNPVGILPPLIAWASAEGAGWIGKEFWKSVWANTFSAALWAYIFAHNSDGQGAGGQPTAGGGQPSTAGSAGGGAAGSAVGGDPPAGGRSTPGADGPIRLPPITINPGIPGSTGADFDLATNEMVAALAGLIKANDDLEKAQKKARDAITPEEKDAAKDEVDKANDAVKEAERNAEDKIKKAHEAAKKVVKAAPKDTLDPSDAFNSAACQASFGHGLTDRLLRARLGKDWTDYKSRLKRVGNWSPDQTTPFDALGVRACGLDSVTLNTDAQKCRSIETCAFGQTRDSQCGCSGAPSNTAKLLQNLRSNACVATTCDSPQAKATMRGIVCDCSPAQPVEQSGPLPPVIVDTMMGTFGTTAAYPASEAIPVVRSLFDGLPGDKPR